MEKKNNPAWEKEVLELYDVVISFALNKLENNLGSKLITIHDKALKRKKHLLSNYQTIKIT